MQSGYNGIGWAAIDDFSLIRSENCEFLPKEAFPSSTPAQPSTTPQNEGRIR